MNLLNPLNPLNPGREAAFITYKEIMMKYLIDDNYVPLSSSLSNAEYLMEKVLLDARYMENLAEGLDDNDETMMMIMMTTMMMKTRIMKTVPTCRSSN